ncbi:hypothetical protein RRG08_040901 [Elysia crispata]|uniref:Uncharacterized protein n=1 Tax=Elysia crispata TaxID=231223 RepID=A0AAE1DLY7_9GAST|nr:hypothetical protein RRG08_040901 [Elysia crispata]
MDITDGRLTCPPTDQTFSSQQSETTITVKWFTLTTEGSHQRQVAFSNTASELYIVDSKCARGNCDGRQDPAKTQLSLYSKTSPVWLL